MYRLLFITLRYAHAEVLGTPVDLRGTCCQHNDFPAWSREEIVTFPVWLQSRFCYNFLPTVSLVSGGNCNIPVWSQGPFLAVFLVFSGHRALSWSNARMPL